MKLHEFYNYLGIHDEEARKRYYAFHARGDYSCIRCGEMLNGAELQKGCPACGFNGQVDPMPEKLYNVWDYIGNRQKELEERVKQLECVLRELADLMDATIVGEYKPDSLPRNPHDVF
jgi:hypothetical protein